MAYPETLLEKKLFAYDQIAADVAVESPTRAYHVARLAMAKAQRGNNSGEFDGVVTRTFNQLGYTDATSFADVKAKIVELMELELVIANSPADPGEEPPVVLPTTKLTRLAFRNRLTVPEKVAIYTAAGSSVQLKVFIDDLNNATYVDLTRPDTIAAVQSLASFGLLTPERATAILETPVTEEEAWRY